MRGVTLRQYLYRSPGQCRCAAHVEDGRCMGMWGVQPTYNVLGSVYWAREAYTDQSMLVGSSNMSNPKPSTYLHVNGT